VAIDDVAPRETTEGIPVTVHLEGYGFAAGSEVQIGGRAARGVDVIDDRELSFRVDESLQVGRHDISVTTPAGDRALRRGGFTVLSPPASAADCSLQTVRFDFNEASLTNGAQQQLDSNAACMESQASLRVQLVGHADERGSTLYNLSLGQRRADSVRQYLVNMGIGSARLATLSYGEERPEQGGRTESAWATNRRVEFLVR
jgi:peptidoglycan-associated lipoprotein